MSNILESRWLIINMILPLEQVWKCATNMNSQAI